MIKNKLGLGVGAVVNPNAQANIGKYEDIVAYKNENVEEILRQLGSFDYGRSEKSDPNHEFHPLQLLGNFTNLLCR